MSQDQTTADQTVAPLYDPRLASHDVRETLAAGGEFTRFLGLLRAAGLDAELQSASLLTVFAPADEFLAELPASIGQPESLETLQAALRAQLVNGALVAADLHTTGQLATRSGRHIPVQIVEGVPEVGGQRVVRANIACTNGVIHATDGFFAPQE